MRIVSKLKDHHRPSCCPTPWSTPPMSIYSVALVKDAPRIDRPIDQIATHDCAPPLPHHAWIVFVPTHTAAKTLLRSLFRIRVEIIGMMIARRHLASSSNGVVAYCYLRMHTPVEETCHMCTDDPSYISTMSMGLHTSIPLFRPAQSIYLSSS